MINVDRVRFFYIIDIDSSKPVLLDIKTNKGYGYPPAESASDKIHGVGKFDLGTGTQYKRKAMPPSLTSVFANTLIEVATEDRAIVGITAAMHAWRNKNGYFWKTIPQSHF